MTMISTAAPNNVGSVKLTNPQMNIWSGQMLSPNVPLYNMVMAFHFKGAIDVNRFKSAFQELTNQNDVLRLVLTTVDTLPKQFFLPELESKLEFMDFSGIESPSASYDKWVAKNKGKMFDAGEVLYQAVLFKLNTGHFIWYFNHHHLMTDGVTINLLYDRLNQNYCQQKEYLGNATPFHYQKIAEQFPYDQIENHSAYWNELKKSLIVTPSLYGNRPVNSSSKSTRISVNLGKARTDKLKILALTPQFKSWNVDMTLFNIFQTILSALVYKVSGQEEFFTGFASHNRILKSHRHTAGLFMELIPLRVIIEKEDSMISLFEKTKKASFEVMKYASESKASVELLKSFNAVLNFIPNSFNNFDDIPVTCDWIHSGHSDPGHHIRLQIHDFNDQGDYQLQFDLNDALFDNFTQKNIPQHFINLVDAFIENKDLELEDINMITDVELNKIRDWNNTSVNYPENETLLTNFSKQVESIPNDVALIFRGETISYRELDEKSNQVAQFLYGQGIQSNDIIIVSLERSLEMIFFIYGIIKVGAAYLPVDTAIPAERLKFIVKDAQAKILFFNHDGIDVENIGGISSFKIEEINSKIASSANTPLDRKIKPQDLAYIIYTSGSTGKPKGVKCHHQGICNRLNWMNNEYPITNIDTLIQKTPITFDVSLWELFWPLQTGARLAIEVPEGHQSPERLIKTILENQVTVIHFVPTMLNVFINTPEVEMCKSLNRVFCSGETLSIPTVEKTYSKLDVDIYNLYGPTEASVDVTRWNCKKPETAAIPIGYPAANTQLYIQDEKWNLLPIGVIGELYIAGSQVAHGYLNRDGLTNERFVKNIHTSNSNAKMYKTGDLVRYRADGAIEYHGRKDNQIKLRGLRIELEEIEKVIEKHADIHQAVAKLNTTGKQEYIVAYYTGKSIKKEEIKDLLIKDLPNYMVPSFFVFVGEFELLSSGKVNRKKLPNHSVESLQMPKDFIDPRNQIEEIILGIWKEIMKLKKISVDENFIQIGGNSLVAMVITSRLKTAFELDLSMNLVFKYPTIIEYAAHVEKTIIELLEEQ